MTCFSRIFAILAMVVTARDAAAQFLLPECVTSPVEVVTRRQVPGTGVLVQQPDIQTLQVIDEVGGELRLRVDLSVYPAIQELTKSPGLSPIAVVSDTGKATQRAYFADGLGTVWRLVLPAAPLPEGPKIFSLHPVAHLGTGEVFLFMEPPELIRTVDARGRPFIGVLLTALRQTKDSRLQTSIYYLRDFSIDVPTNTSEPYRPTDLKDLSACGAVRDCVDDNSAGWHMQLSSPDERIAGRALIWRGRVYAVTYQSDTVDCEARTADTRLLVVDLPSGPPEGVQAARLDLGRQTPREVTVQAERLWWPGDTGQLPGIDDAALGIYRLTWRDLLIDEQ